MMILHNNYKNVLQVESKGGRCFCTVDDELDNVIGSFCTRFGVGY